jgi:formate hydrogenlyase subunit 6/NADH:ubiquinone oxidoreductase subunit I
MTAPAVHGFIGLVANRCTSCLICVQECPSWCITLDSHYEQVAEEGARRPRTVSILDDFRIDYGLCMYCGICVDLCPFDALVWLPRPADASSGRQGLHLGLSQLDPLEERRVASELFNHVWSLLETEDRTEAQDDAMVHAAHASRWHWGRVGSPQQWAIGEWQCSRVYATLGRAEPALHHARRCLELGVTEGVDPFVEASAHEAMARALAVGGDLDGARVERELAYRLAVDLDDDDDRAVIESDLATLPIP